MVFQSYALYPHMDVAENIAFPLTTGWKARADRATRDKMVREVAKLVEVDLSAREISRPAFRRPAAARGARAAR